MTDRKIKAGVDYTKDQAGNVEFRAISVELKRWQKDFDNLEQKARQQEGEILSLYSRLAGTVPHPTCPECQSNMSTWHCEQIAKGSAVDGRLRLNDVSTIFFLACNFCSETILTRTGDEIAFLLAATNPEGPHESPEQRARDLEATLQAFALDRLADKIDMANGKNPLTFGDGPTATSTAIIRAEANRLRDEANQQSESGVSHE